MPRRDIVFGSTKTYEAVVSTAFRQWMADSHCAQNHGYALRFCVTFEADYLDGNNWVVDFGSLKSFKAWLEQLFDHTTLVATDDPQLEWFRKGHEMRILELREVEATGCERTALMVFEYLERWLKDHDYSPRVTLMRVDVHEHELNSAYVRRA